MVHESFKVWICGLKPNPTREGVISVYNFWIALSGFILREALIQYPLHILVIISQKYGAFVNPLIECEN